MNNESSFCSNVRIISSSNVFRILEFLFFHRLKKEVILAKIPDCGACGDVAFYLIFNRFIDFKKVDIAVSHCNLAFYRWRWIITLFRISENDFREERLHKLY